jgi:hypothetical protein
MSCDSKIKPKHASRISIFVGLFFITAFIAGAIFLLKSKEYHLPFPSSPDQFDSFAIQPELNDSTEGQDDLRIITINEASVPEISEIRHFFKRKDTREISIKLPEYIASLKSMVDNNPSDPDLRLKLAVAFNDAGMYVESLAELRKIIEIAPDYARRQAIVEIIKDYDERTSE